jgi:hypothetical protein|tara:strand:+ start:224 stop:829 length:606 start_codon:yes stop_codon:yes gene_type:complete
MSKKLIFFSIVLILINGCAKMKPIDFKNTVPQFILEEYFKGSTQASGIFEDRFGNIRRQFSVDITGTWNGQDLVLDEQFLYDDGERDQRIWTIKKINAHTYKGRADDVIGAAHGEAYGNALNWRYDMNLKIGSSTIKVHFNDWMFLQSSGILLNRAEVSKFGIKLGTVILAFIKTKKDGVAKDSKINLQPSEVLISREASQ